MSKIMLFLSFLGLSFMMAGTAYDPQSSVFWLASGDVAFQTVRGALGGILLLQMLTNPPRNVKLRILAGLVSAAAAYWAIQETFAYQMQILDSLIFLAASIAIAVSALERKNYPQEEAPVYSARLKNTSVYSH